MNIKINKNTFREMVHIVSRFAERKTTSLPALASILITATTDGITFKATNLEAHITLSVEGEVVTPGALAFPALLLTNVASSFSGNGSVTIEQKGETAVISSGAGKSVLKTVSVEDFPLISSSDKNKKTFSIQGAILKQLIGTVVSCASNSTIRPELASVRICAEGGKLSAAATDSFRLIEKHIPLPGGVPSFITLIPAKNIAEILPVLPDAEIEVSLDDHQGSFTWAKNSISTRLVAAQYPDYTQIIPKTFVTEATLARKDFEEALRRTAVFSDSFQKVKLAFDTKKKQVVVSATHTDTGESVEPVGASISGDAIELSFNYRYLQTPLPLMGTETITLSSGGIGRPLVIRGVGEQGFLYLVMPMNQ